MFRLAERLSKHDAPDTRRYLKRAGLFAAGLGLLWLALRLSPSHDAPKPPAVYSDASGTIAAKSDVEPYGGPSLFTWGNLTALIILVGGGAAAVVLHRRSRRPGSDGSAIYPMGTLNIGQGQQLRLVQCGGEVLLLGATSNQINLLRAYNRDEFEDAGPIESDDEVAPDPTESGIRFAEVFSQYTGGRRQVAETGATW